MRRSLAPGLVATLCATSLALATSAPAGDLPVAPRVTTVYPQMEGATIYFTSQPPAHGHYVRQYTATSDPGGITATSLGNSNRIDFAGLTGGTRYTFTVTATNDVGTGPPSAPSKSVTAAAYADYWVVNGAGLNENWSYYPGSAGDAVTWKVTVSGMKPPTGSSVIRFQTTGTEGDRFTLPYIVHSLADSNGNPNGVGSGGGKFPLGAFKTLAVSVWPTQPGQKVGFQLYQTNALNGMLTQETGASPDLLTDTTQSWPPGQLAARGFTFFDLTTGKASNIKTNTSDTLTLTAPLQVPSAAGDYYELSEPDLQVGKYVQVGDGHNSGWGPATMTVGQWNTYRIPLTSFDTAAFPYGNQILKFALQDHSGRGTNTFYVTALGFTRN
jgi:hypothetical protein